MRIQIYLATTHNLQLLFEKPLTHDFVSLY